MKKAPEAAKDVKAATKPATAAAKPAAAKPAPTKEAAAKKAPAGSAAPKKDAKAAPAAAKKAAPTPAAAPPAKKAAPAAAKAAAPAAAAPAAAAAGVAKPAAKVVVAKPKPKVAAPAPSKVVKKNVLRGKGLKKKKVSLRFTIDCTNIAEDNIMDVADFVSTNTHTHSRVTLHTPQTHHQQSRHTNITSNDKDNIGNSVTTPSFSLPQTTRGSG